jgi:transposase
VIKVATYDTIRELHFNKGLSKREIAKRLMVHRNTVTRALEREDNEYLLTVEKEKPVNGNFIDRIKVMLEENSNTRKKERLTKTRMHELLQEEGYDGSYSAFTYQVRILEEELGINAKEAYVKLDHGGGVLQVDFGEMTVMDGGYPRKIIVFCAKLSSEKAEFIQAYPRQSTEFFFDGLIRSFDFYGGVPRKIIFDNLKPAVKEVLEGSERVLQDEFLKFKSFYCFEAEFCGPGKGNEKGLVENLVKYTRNNYFLPHIDFKGFDKLNDSLYTKCWNKMQEKKVNNISWYQALKESLEDNFLPIKGHFDHATLTTAKVDSYQLVNIDRNRYSVPINYVGKKVDVKIYPFEVKIIYKGKLIAEHERLFSKDKDQLEPYHFLDLLMMKPRAYDDALVIKQWRLPKEFDNYHRMLQATTKSKSKGTREFINILKLTKSNGIEKIGQLLRELDKINRYSYEEVLSLLRFKEDIKLDKKVPTEILEAMGVSDIKSSSPRISQYNKLLEGGVDIERRVI